MRTRRTAAVAGNWPDRLSKLIRALRMTPAQFFRLTGVPPATGYHWLEGSRVPNIDNPHLQTIVEETPARWEWLTDGRGKMLDGRQRWPR